MKKLIFSLLALTLIVMTGCSSYDDGPLSDRVNDLEKRVATLEELCRQLNTNVSSIQTIVNAVKEQDAITSITPIKQGGQEIGYTITFKKSPAITIYHGKDGQNGTNGADGSTPAIGVKQDSDGHYYWTLNGQWLTDASGNKVSAEGAEGAAGNDGQNGQDGQNGADGKDGKDGITPQLKIEDGDWYISLDSGSTWEYLGRATGADGQDGADGSAGDSMFTDIDTSSPDSVTFTLANGTTFTLPRQAELAITIDNDGLLSVATNATLSVGYTITGDTRNLNVAVLTSGTVKARVSDNTASSGTIAIQTGPTLDEYDKVILLATNGNVTVMSSIRFEEGILRLVSGTSYTVDAAGGSIDITIETNTDYTLSIPEEAQSWISLAASRALRQETITLSIAANDGAARTATLELMDKEGNVSATLSVSQTANTEIPVAPTIPDDMTVAFPDEIFRQYVLDNFDTDHNSKISGEEALKVTSINVSNMGIKSLEGIQYFQNLDTLDCWQNKVTALDVSKLSKLKCLNCAANQLASLDVTALPELEILGFGFDNITSIDLSKNTKLTQFACQYSALTNLDLSNQPNLIWLDCTGNSLTTLDVSKTNLGNSTERYPLYCAPMKIGYLKTLYLKTGWDINGITSNRNVSCITSATEIVFVD